MEHPLDPGYYSSEDLRSFGFKVVGEDVLVARNCTMIGVANISFGDHVRVDGNTVIAAHSGHAIIGSHVHVGGGCHLACMGGVTLADFSGLSQGVKIYSASDDYSGRSLTNPTVPREFLRLDVAPVELRRHVIIGAGSVVLPGVTIEEGSAVGALSLVTKSLAAWGIYFGSPVSRIKSRSRNLLALEAELMRKRAR